MGFFSSKRHGVYKNVNGVPVYVRDSDGGEYAAITETTIDVEELPEGYYVPSFVEEEKSQEVLEEVVTILPVGEPVAIPKEEKEPVKKILPPKKSVPKKKVAPKKEKT